MHSARAADLSRELAGLLTPAEFEVHATGAVDLHPRSADKLASAVAWAHRHEPASGIRFNWHRDQLTALSSADVTSCLIHAGAGVPLGRVESELARAGLTLGPLTPRERGITVAAWLEGPSAGLRAIPGGRLETAALNLEAVLWTGERYRSHPSPRKAAGPDLDFLFLGGGEALGLITGATLRAFTRPTSEDAVAVALDSPAQAAAILRDALGHEAVPARAELTLNEGRPVLTVRFAGLAFRAHRDAARLRETARIEGGTVLERLPPPLSLPAVFREYEVAWDALPALLSVAAAGGLSLHRLAREAVVVACAAELSGDGVVGRDGLASRPEWLSRVAGALR